MTHNWQSGYPPYSGWYLTKVITDIGGGYRWRWFENNLQKMSYWSWGCYEHYHAQYAAQEAKIPSICKHSSIQWCDYWPENARVPRIDPRK